MENSVNVEDERQNLQKKKIYINNGLLWCTFFILTSVINSLNLSVFVLDIIITYHSELFIFMFSDVSFVFLYLIIF